ncbi:SDR family NAD(P)-dependent oxidoreductase [Mariniradius sediminis]|uniref:SDR family NAD(P)-dependent oxidoreductase n=1 Tax=Mariniradius sediminis TaxID=2909237 RepID=A0ABS9BY97_9BACT|nr:SDR family NAD(P)-dependent oxidoreductase [Mariniradius sediminis]MCF1752669.1 SDR family NAD(P)-dependent oxidoreductase [Mariniradius sediminis]
MRHFALITGSSDGLGKAFAIECAQRQMDLLLVSLPDTGLPELCKFLKDNFEVRVEYFEIDLTVESNCEKLVNHVLTKSYPISFLINNAGMGGYAHFPQEDYATFDRMIQLNIKALTIITHGILPILLKQQLSFILNVSSMIVHFAGPYKQIYGATKSYVHYFTKSLALELGNTNTKVSVLCPSGVNSNIKIFRMHNSCNFFQTISLLYPEQVADYAIIQTLKGKTEIIPGKVVRIIFTFSKLLPAQIKKWMTKMTTQRMLKSYEGLKLKSS